MKYRVSKKIRLYFSVSLLVLVIKWMMNPDRWPIIANFWQESARRKYGWSKDAIDLGGKAWPIREYWTWFFIERDAFCSSRVYPIFRAFIVIIFNATAISTYLIYLALKMSMLFMCLLTVLKFSSNIKS